MLLTSEGEHALSRHTTRIVIKNCPNVFLTNHTLALMDGLVSVDLINITKLGLVRHSFKLSQKATKVYVTIRNSSLESLPSNVFHGGVENVLLEDVRFNQIMAFAFANLVDTNTITIKNCQIDTIEAQAFKKFDVKHLHIMGGTLGNEEVPSRTMNDIEVKDTFMLDGVRMGIVRSSAFIVRKPNTVTILNCDIDSLESQAFDIGTRGTVIIKNNTMRNVAFGAFLSIKTDQDSKPNIANLPSLMFKNNTLGSFEEGSLLFDRPSFRTELTNVLVNQQCDCNQLALWKSQILNYTNAHSRIVTYRDSTNIVAPPLSMDSISEDPETFLCVEDPETGLTSTFVEYELKNCALSGSILLLVLAISGLIFGLVVLACTCIYCCRRRGRDDSKRWISVPTTAPDVVSKSTNGNVIGGKETSNTTGGPVDSRITMVVPDGRLYRETEFHVIVEKAEPLTTEL